MFDKRDDKCSGSSFHSETRSGSPWDEDRLDLVRKFNMKSESFLVGSTRIEGTATVVSWHCLPPLELLLGTQMREMLFRALTTSSGPTRSWEPGARCPATRGTRARIVLTSLLTGGFGRPEQ